MICGVEPSPDVGDVDRACSLVILRRGKGGKDRFAPRGAQARRGIEDSASPATE